MLLALLIALTFAAEDYTGHLDNARLFLRKSYLPDAELELEAAVEHPEGRRDPEAWYLLAKVRYQRLDMPGARDAASRAHTYARTEAQVETASTFAAYLTEQFAPVAIEAPWEGLQVHLELSLSSLVLDPEQKDWIARSVAALQSAPVLLPHTLYLPLGTYIINGREVTVGVDQRAHVLLKGAALSTRPLPTAQLSQGELGLGVSHGAGSPAARTWLPSPAAHAAWSIPIGAVIGGLTLDWSPRLYARADGSLAVAAQGWALGARVGREISRSGALRSRLSAGLRAGPSPGLALRCLGTEPVRCTQTGPADLELYPTGWAWIPTVELLLDSTHPGRHTRLGFGVKALGEVSIGSLPASGTASISGEEPFPFEVLQGSRTWVAPGMRFYFHTTLAF